VELEKKIMIPLIDRISIGFQSLITRTGSLGTYLTFVFWMKYVRKYKIYNVDRIRKKFAQIIDKEKGPVIICPNHLTMLDSALIMWALSPIWRFIFDPASFPWNFPRKILDDPLSAVACYIGRCMILQLGNQEQTKRTINRIKYLLTQGHSIMVFPEGRRSRSGRIDTNNFTYGVGSLVQAIPNAKVLCVYLRGVKHNAFTDLPQRSEEFHIDLQLIRPTSVYHGLRGSRDIATQVIHKLAQMEQEYFEKTGQHRQ
jgi:hypothetical protein